MAHPFASLYDEIERLPLSFAPARGRLERTAQKHPELVVRSGPNILVASDDGSAMAYGFAGQADFVTEFAPMFDAVTKPLRALNVETAMFRLTSNPMRPVVEPVLRGLSFEPRPPWLGFTLRSAAPLLKLPPAAGIRFRDGTLGDVDALQRIDRSCFFDTPMPGAALRRRLKEGAQVLIAEAKSDAVGFALYELARADAGGYLVTLAVMPEQRGRGIGAGLTTRVSKRVFAGGANELSLKTDEDNGDAIRLYLRLGFRQDIAGRDYTRPLDPRVVERLRRAQQGTLVRFGGWR